MKAALAILAIVSLSFAIDTGSPEYLFPGVLATGALVASVLNSVWLRRRAEEHVRDINSWRRSRE
jgi:hypothetical protein